MRYPAASPAGAGPCTGSMTMRAKKNFSLMLVAASLLVSGCQRSADHDATATAAGAGAPATAATWPASLNVFGDGFPNPGDPCRRIGESEATMNFLDHTATLAGCLSADEAAKLGGRV